MKKIIERVKKNIENELLRIENELKTITKENNFHDYYLLKNREGFLKHDLKLLKRKRLKDEKLLEVLSRYVNLKILKEGDSDEIK